ncbi:hypothetical protein SprV_0401660400 [Sparganum proliferum]
MTSLTVPVAVEDVINLLHRLRAIHSPIPPRPSVSETCAKNYHYMPIKAIHREHLPMFTMNIIGKRMQGSELHQQKAMIKPLLDRNLSPSDPSTAAATAAADTKAAIVGGGGVSNVASAQSSGVGVGASTPLRVNMLNDLIQQMVSLKHTPSSVSLVGAGNMTATDDGPNNTGVIGSSSTTKSQPTLPADERKQLELTITSALTRAQRLLDNDTARKALGGTYIYQTDWLSSKPKSDMPFAHVHVDLVGSLSTSCGCKYLLTAVDRFARWSFTTPTLKVAADTVPRAFLQHWISHCAVPTTNTID